MGDYSLHMDLFTNDQYQKECDNNKSLVKWSAPEVLEGEDLSAVTTESDVVCINTSLVTIFARMFTST